jgi:hypothetical protein
VPDYTFDLSARSTDLRVVVLTTRFADD